MYNTIEQKSCAFCSQHISYVDYKDIQFMRKFMSPHAKILSAQRTGTCTKHQRMVARALKRARHMALLPFVPA
ncbi:MAG: 30S ribosomal protein S18 [Candidatus Doudnabacteria bacterium RIFCSPHIGHO2_02_FULL_46_11]|uniref:Small ribosomal subunit protein bS18 n=1 Tax=Candidatus Doudnabacteria bacterium RIFCSPHIGHO2_02_FULL_46_11 TaxID=1817832 RepID=A0A1F5P8C5_9BACT|nr:MAG: 30S ribosomal protein S18 [Candidatus Doudnabacteria bacterium RIFCSPHIGHO2_02_FULL_46_11]